MLRYYYGQVSCHGDVLIQNHKQLDICGLVFFLVYFFGVAGGAWWLNLSLSWFLAAGLFFDKIIFRHFRQFKKIILGCKWGGEAIAKKWAWFQITGWGLPTILTTFAYHSGIQGDPVSGICFLGNIYFFVIPMTTFILLGAFFLFWGFIELLRIRKVKKKLKTFLKETKNNNHDNR